MSDSDTNVVASIAYFCLGAGMLTGSSIVLTEFTPLNDLTEGSGEGVLISYIVVGGAAVLLGAIFFFMSISDGPMSMKTFQFFAALLFVAEISVSVVGLRMREEISSHVNENLHEIMTAYLDIRGAEFRMDEIQQKMECCGTNHYTDWFDTFYESACPNPEGRCVPMSCCRKGYEPLCVYDDVPVEDDLAKVIIYTTGCQQVLTNTLMKSMIKVCAPVVTFAGLFNFFILLLPN